MNGAPEVGWSERGAEAIAEAIKIHRRGEKFEWPPLDRDAEENTILVLVRKIFWGGSKNNQL